MRCLLPETSKITNILHVDVSALGCVHNVWQGGGGAGKIFKCQKNFSTPHSQLSKKNPVIPLSKNKIFLLLSTHSNTYSLRIGMTRYMYMTQHKKFTYARQSWYLVLGLHCLPDREVAGPSYIILRSQRHATRKYAHHYSLKYRK